MLQRFLPAIAACALLLSVVAPARANRAPVPEPPPKKPEAVRTVKAPLIVESTAPQRQTVIVIPRRFVAQAGKSDRGTGAAPKSAAPASPNSPFEAPGEGAADENTGALEGISRHRTTIAGLALALAACSFVVVARRKSRGGTVAGLLLLAGGCFGAGAAMADVAPPPDPPKTQVLIRYVETGNAVVLIPGTDFRRPRR